MPKYYFLTISPPKRKGGDLFLYRDDRYEITRLLNKCSDHYMIYPEFDHHMRLHYHGIFRMSSYQRWFKTVKKGLSSIGFIDVSLLKSSEEHLRSLYYCMKDYHMLYGSEIKRWYYKKQKKIRDITNKSNPLDGSPYLFQFS